MSPADVDVPRKSPTEIVKATDNYPHLHGWDTQLNPPVAHMSPEHPMRTQKSAEHRIQMPRSCTNTCSFSWWWSVLDLLWSPDQRDDTCEGPGNTSANARERQFARFAREDCFVVGTPAALQGSGTAFGLSLRTPLKSLRNVVSQWSQ